MEKFAIGNVAKFQNAINDPRHIIYCKNIRKKVTAIFGSGITFKLTSPTPLRFRGCKISKTVLLINFF